MELRQALSAYRAAMARKDEYVARNGHDGQPADGNYNRWDEAMADFNADIAEASEYVVAAIPQSLLTIDISQWSHDRLGRVGDYAMNRQLGLGEAIGELVEHGLSDIEIWGTNVQ